MPLVHGLLPNALAVPIVNQMRWAIRRDDQQRDALVKGFRHRRCIVQTGRSGGTDGGRRLAAGYRGAQGDVGGCAFVQGGGARLSQRRQGLHQRGIARAWRIDGERGRQTA